MRPIPFFERAASRCCRPFGSLPQWIQQSICPFSTRWRLGLSVRLMHTGQLTPCEARFFRLGGAFAVRVLRRSSLFRICNGSPCGSPWIASPCLETSSCQPTLSTLRSTHRVTSRYPFQEPRLRYHQVSLTGLVEPWTSVVCGNRLSPARQTSRHAFQGVDVIAFTLWGPSPHAGHAGRMCLAFAETAFALAHHVPYPSNKPAVFSYRLFKATTLDPDRMTVAPKRALPSMPKHLSKTSSPNWISP
jgi:hypothetical protein